MINGCFRQDSRQTRKNKWFHPFRNSKHSALSKNATTSQLQEQNCGSVYQLQSDLKKLNPLQSGRQRRPSSSYSGRFLPLKMAVSVVVNCRTSGVEDSAGPQMYYQKKNADRPGSTFDGGNLHTNMDTTCIPSCMERLRTDWNWMSKIKSADRSCSTFDGDKVHSVDSMKRHESDMNWPSKTENGMTNFRTLVSEQETLDTEEAEDCEMFQFTPPDNTLYDNVNLPAYDAAERNRKEAFVGRPPLQPSNRNPTCTATKASGQFNSCRKFMTSEDFLRPRKRTLSFSDTSSPTLSLSSIQTISDTNDDLKIPPEFTFNVSQHSRPVCETKVLNALQMFSLNDSTAFSSLPLSVNDKADRFPERNRFAETRSAVIRGDATTEPTSRAATGTADTVTKKEIESGPLGDEEELVEVFFTGSSNVAESGNRSVEKVPCERRVPQCRRPFLTCPEEEDLYI